MALHSMPPPPVPAANFTLLDPQDRLHRYESSPGVERCFCSECGSPLFSYRPDSQLYKIRVGTLDEVVLSQPAQHIYYTYRAPWLCITDLAPRYPEGL